MGVLPSVIVRLSSSVDAAGTINEIANRFNIALKSKLPLAARDYEFTLPLPLQDIGEVFTMARTLGSLPSVEWAEPNMVVSVNPVHSR
jgi:hypothetical protein